MYGHGAYGIHGGAIREQLEKPGAYLPIVMSDAKVIAELGCGSGFYCKYLQKLAEKLYCVDASAEAVEGFSLWNVRETLVDDNALQVTCWNI